MSYVCPKCGKSALCLLKYQLVTRKKWLECRCSNCGYKWTQPYVEPIKQICKTCLTCGKQICGNTQEEFTLLWTEHLASHLSYTYAQPTPTTPIVEEPPQAQLICINCDICGKQICATTIDYALEQLYEHKKVKHEIPEPPRYCCYNCANQGKIICFNTQAELDRHIQDVHGEPKVNWILIGLIMVLLFLGILLFTSRGK